MYFGNILIFFKKYFQGIFRAWSRVYGCDSLIVGLIIWISSFFFSINVAIDGMIGAIVSQIVGGIYGGGSTREELLKSGFLAYNGCLSFIGINLFLSMSIRTKILGFLSSVFSTLILIAASERQDQEVI